MHKEEVLIVWVPIVCILLFCLAAVGIGTCNNPGGNPEGSVIDTSGIDRAGGIADSIGERISVIEDAALGTREGIDSSRSLVAGSLSIVGGIGDGVATITGGLDEAQSRVRRIEAASLRIEQALSGLGAGEEVLDDSGH